MLNNYEQLYLWNEIAIMQSLKDVLKSLKTLDLPYEQAEDNLRDRSWLTNRIKDTMEFIKKEDTDEEIHTTR